MKHAINQETLSETQSLNELTVKCAMGGGIAVHVISPQFIASSHETLKAWS